MIVSIALTPRVDIGNGIGLAAIASQSSWLTSHLNPHLISANASGRVRSRLQCPTV